MRSGLPIDEALPALTAALESSRSVVLQAPPGAGKSTAVPLVLLEQPWMKGKRLLMLEPRRLAARAVAHRMAQTLGQVVGATVGYRMRMDTRVSRDTRIEVITEGILTRMLQTDPSLEGVAAVLFDEFHERSLQADLGLAFTLDARSNLTPDLRVLVMSATLDGAAVAKLLGDAPIVTTEGRVFPVESRYVGKSAPLLPPASYVPGQESTEAVLARTIVRALSEEPGDLLAFLPGAREIRRVQSLLETSELDRSVRVLPLFGELSAGDQDQALLPSKPGTRKVVLSTNIAETSLTLQGVRIVVDSGLVRRSIFDPSTGMSRLETRRISRASADQRQGRAGRVEPGVCYRVWSEGAQPSLAPFTPPEIVEADLTPLAIELADWGARNAAELQWLDPPPEAMLGSARDLLRHLGALSDDGRITPHGRRMNRLSIHPRLAHMLIRAAGLNALRLAADLAALLSERDLLRAAAGSKDVDIRSRLELLRGEGVPAGVDKAALHRARRTAKDLVQQVGTLETQSRDSAPTSEGVLLALAYPDRIGRRRGGSDGARYTLANGRGAHFADLQNLSKSEFIVAVDLDDRDRDARILLAAPLTREEIEQHLPDRLERGASVEWNPREQAVTARRFVRLDAILLEEKPLQDVPVESARAAMVQGIREMGLDALPWTRDARELQARIEFVRQLQSPTSSSTALSGGAAPSSSSSSPSPPSSPSPSPSRSMTLPAGTPDWPEVSDASLSASLGDWLTPWLEGITRRDHLARLSMTDILRSLLPWEKQRELDRLAPTHLTVPSGANIRIDYLDESAPVVSVRLQHVFGLDATPRIGGGAVPITFKLLSPAQRPVQVTRDLASFWRGSYAEVRKDMRGRYPKHYWPSLQELADIRKK